MQEIERVRVDQLPPPDWDPKSVRSDVNALGFPPHRVLFLWPFARPINLRAQVIGHGWAQIGPVNLLLRPGWGLMRHVLQTVDDVRDALEGFREQPGRQKAPQMRFGDGSWGRYDGYPVNPLTVGNSVWKAVIELLVKRCDIFVADMTAKRRPAGLAFELTHLFERVASNRLILLIDAAQADVEGCCELVDTCWYSAKKRRRRPPVLFLYDSQARDYVMKGFKGAFGGGGGTIPIAAKTLARLGWV